MSSPALAFSSVIEQAILPDVGILAGAVLFLVAAIVGIWYLFYLFGFKIGLSETAKQKIRDKAAKRKAAMPFAITRRSKSNPATNDVAAEGCPFVHGEDSGPFLVSEFNGEGGFHSLSGEEFDSLMFFDHKYDQVDELLSNVNDYFSESFSFQHNDNYEPSLVYSARALAEPAMDVLRADFAGNGFMTPSMQRFFDDHAFDDDAGDLWRHVGKLNQLAFERKRSELLSGAEV